MRRRRIIVRVVVSFLNWRRACYRIHGHTRRLMINTTVLLSIHRKFSDFVQLKDYRPPPKRSTFVISGVSPTTCSAIRPVPRKTTCGAITCSCGSKSTSAAQHEGGQVRLALFYASCSGRGLDGVRGAAHARPDLPLVLSASRWRRTGRRAPAEVEDGADLHLPHGLRVGEAVRVELRDLQDTRTDHPRLYVRCGKGGKDRYVPLALPLVKDLRQWWKIHRHPQWLFPGRERTGASGVECHRSGGAGDTPLSVSAWQHTFRLARPRGPAVAATVHTLRHCYATHLLEEE